MNTSTPPNRYAWLENEEGIWHFLTDLLSDPGESTRNWTDSMRAIEELKKEGWTVISPYPETASISRNSNEEACGYGLVKRMTMDDLRMTNEKAVSIVNRQSSIVN